MKYQIKQNLRSHIITVAFLLALSLTALFILFNSTVPEQKAPVRVVSGILILTEGKTVPFANNEGTARLIKSTVAFPHCADCMETAQVEVIKGNEQKMLHFRFGGIAGFHDDTGYAFNYEFVVRELLDESVTIEYKKVN